MAICARAVGAQRGSFPPRLLAAAVLSTLVTVTAGGCGDDEPFTSVVIAARTDGGSPALSVFAGDLWENPVELAPGDYYVTAINKDDDIFSFEEITVEDGQKIAVAPFSGSRPDHEFAEAVRTTANFLVDLEMGRLGVMEGMSGGFTTALFDPAGEPAGEDLEALFQAMERLTTQEEALMAALRVIDDSSAEARGRVLYTDARAPVRGALLNDIIDMMPQFFRDIAGGNERERARVIGITKEMSAQDSEETFRSMPEDLRGGASNFEEWMRNVKDGSLDSQMPRIHNHLSVSAPEATQESGHTIGRAIAEDGSRLINSGTDLIVKTYGKVPGVGKAIDLTKKAKEWDAYLQKVYADPLGTLEASARKKAESALADQIKKDLAKLAPGLSKSTLDSLSKQLAKNVVASIPGLQASPTAAPVAGSDEEWIEGIVQTVADRLLADGERGIDVAVVTDDLRQCLADVLANAMSRQEALSRCQSGEAAASQWIDEAVYYAQKQLEAGGMMPDESLGQALAYGNCLRAAWWTNGATREEAQAECEGFLDLSPPPAEPTAPQTPTRTPVAATPASTPCNADPDGDGITDLDSIIDCLGTPTPAPTPCAEFDPLCGLSQ